MIPCLPLTDEQISPSWLGSRFTDYFTSPQLNVSHDLSLFNVYLLSLLEMQ